MKTTNFHEPIDPKQRLDVFLSYEDTDRHGQIDTQTNVQTKLHQQTENEKMFNKY